jgi:cytochrome c oxidase subunit 2
VIPAGSDGRRPGPARAIGLGVCVVALLTLLAGCSVGDTFRGFGWPEEGITQQAHQMYDIWIGSVVAALAVGVFVWGLIFWCVVRYRKRGDEIPPQTRYNMPLEILYTVIPFLIVAVLFYYTAVVQTNVDRRTANPDVTVEVVAFKWNWEFRYLDAKGADGQPISTVGASDYVPVLVLPVGKHVRFSETARDVVHSFWVPELLFKRDVFPGTIRNQFEVVIDRPGAYVGRCAELCGTYHSMMNFEVRAVSPEAYERFIALRKDGKSTPDALTGINENPTATTTHPFDTSRDQRATG